MNFKTFQLFRHLIYERTGISLSDQKAHLVTRRVSGRLKALGLKTEAEYLAYLNEPGHEDEMVRFVDVISTNVTHFFRESDHFKIFATELERKIRETGGPIKIWCAACATGQEAYTLAMMVAEAIEGKRVDVRILATDISISALKAAVQGRYEAEKMQAVPKTLLKKYFEKQGHEYVASQRLKDLILFRQLNLKSNPLPLRGPVDFVFCRNVMIYFDQDLRRQIVSNIYELLKPGHMFFISHTESLAGISSQFKMITPSVFRKPLEVMKDEERVHT